MFRNLSIFTTIGLIVVGCLVFTLVLGLIGCILWIFGAIFAVGSGVFFCTFGGLLVGASIGFALASEAIERKLKMLYMRIKFKYGL